MVHTLRLVEENGTYEASGVAWCHLYFFVFLRVEVLDGLC